MASRELCIRCEKPTSYHPNTPITLRRYFIEGSGQLCERCFYELYPMQVSLQSNLETNFIHLILLEITRARNILKIYWTPEVEHKVLTTIKPRDIKKDVGILRKYI